MAKHVPAQLVIWHSVTRRSVGEWTGQQVCTHVVVGVGVESTTRYTGSRIVRAEVRTQTMCVCVCV